MYCLIAHSAGDYTNTFEEFDSLTDAQTSFKNYINAGQIDPNEDGIELAQWLDDEELECLDWHEW